MPANVRTSQTPTTWTRTTIELVRGLMYSRKKTVPQRCSSIAFDFFDLSSSNLVQESSVDLWDNLNKVRGLPHNALHFPSISDESRSPRSSLDPRPSSPPDLRRSEIRWRWGPGIEAILGQDLPGPARILMLDVWNKGALKTYSTQPTIKESFFFFFFFMVGCVLYVFNAPLWNHTRVRGWDRWITARRAQRGGLWFTVSNPSTSALIAFLTCTNSGSKQCFSYRRFFAPWDASSSIWTQVESFGRFLCFKKLGLLPHKIEKFYRGRPPDPPHVLLGAS